jgi:hypothetical protein
VLGDYRYSSKQSPRICKCARSRRTQRFRRSSSYIYRLFAASQKATIFQTREPIRIGDRVKSDQNVIPARASRHRFGKMQGIFECRALLAIARARGVGVTSTAPCNHAPRGSSHQLNLLSWALPRSGRELRRRVPLSPRLGACARDGVLAVVALKNEHMAALRAWPIAWGHRPGTPFLRKRPRLFFVPTQSARKCLRSSARSQGLAPAIP